MLWVPGTNERRRESIAGVACPLTRCKGVTFRTTAALGLVLAARRKRQELESQRARSQATSPRPLNRAVCSRRTPARPPGWLLVIGTTTSSISWMLCAQPPRDPRPQLSR